jgi:atypical dual specificity phosphatase
VDASATIEVSQEMSGFSWVVDDTLGGMPQPGTRATLEHDLTMLAEQGVDLVVSANFQGIDAEAAAAHGIAHLSLPVEDFQPPTLQQMDRFVSLTRQHIDGGGRLVVHCTAGMGRTGTYLASWFVAEGMAPDQAIAHVRAKRPGSIETASQEQGIHEFWRHRLDAVGSP